MPEVRVPGATIFWTSDGDPKRPALLLSNSLGTTTAMWDGVVARFAQDHHVIRYDTRGHGQSESPPGDYALDRLGDDAVAVLDAAGAAAADVCGISLGGLTGLWLALRRPARIRHLVAANTGARIGTTELWDERIRAVRARGMTAIVDAILGRWFTPAFRAAELGPIALCRGMLETTPTDGYAGCCAALRDADLRSGLKEIRAPTMVIVGTADIATPPMLGEVVARDVPGARLERMDTAHLSNVEQPEAFASLVLGFLGS